MRVVLTTLASLAVGAYAFGAFSMLEACWNNRFPFLVSKGMGIELMVWRIYVLNYIYDGFTVYGPTVEEIWRVNFIDNRPMGQRRCCRPKIFYISTFICDDEHLFRSRRLHLWALVYDQSVFKVLWAFPAIFCIILSIPVSTFLFDTGLYIFCSWACMNCLENWQDELHKFC